MILQRIIGAAPQALVELGLEDIKLGYNSISESSGELNFEENGRVDQRIKIQKGETVAWNGYSIKFLRSGPSTAISQMVNVSTGEPIGPDFTPLMGEFDFTKGESTK